MRVALVGGRLILWHRNSGSDGILGVGQYFLVIAFRFGEVAVLAPFRYFNLVWAVIYGYLFFGDVPQRDIIIGGAVVVGSGLFIWWRELRIKGRL